MGIEPPRTPRRGLYRSLVSKTIGLRSRDQVRHRRGAPWRALLKLSQTDRRLPASALGVRRRADELDANEGLITDDAGVVSWRDGVRVAARDGDSRAIRHPGLQLA